jgi:hypothetical protein
METVEKIVQRFARGFASALLPGLGHSDAAKLGAFRVARFMKSVSREQNAVSRKKWHGVLPIGGYGK